MQLGPGDSDLQDGRRRWTVLLDWHPVPPLALARSQALIASRITLPPDVLPQDLKLAEAAWFLPA
jgi:hypothetical protein